MTRGPMARLNLAPFGVNFAAMGLDDGAAGVEAAAGW